MADGPPEHIGGDCVARRGVVAVAEPWVGVDSSKPPRPFASNRGCAAGLPRRSDCRSRRWVVALVTGGGLATLERLNAAVAGTILAPQGRYFP